MYEVGIAKAFDAWHVMPGVEGPEGQLHQHQYRMEVTASRGELDELGMVCNLDVLEAALDEIVERVRGKQLDDVIAHKDGDAVTVEILAGWGHNELSRRLADQGIERLSIRVWESPDAFGGYSDPLSDGVE